MENTRLILLLKTLDKKEWRELRKFVQSPFVNQREDVIRLFDVLGHFIKAEKAIPEKPIIFKKIYPKESFEDHKIRMIMSFLFRHVEQFLVYKEMFKDEIKVKTKLAEIYRKRNLPKHFERTLKEAKDSLKVHPFQNADFYENTYRIFLEEDQFTVQTRRMSDLKNQEISDNHNITFIARKLRQSLSSLTHQTVYKAQYRFGLLDEVLNFVESEGLLEVPVIAVYYYCYKALTQPQNELHFSKLKYLIFEKSELFPHEEAKDFYVLAINFCIKQYNAGNQKYLKDQFELYKDGLKKNYFLTDGFLSRFAYQNIVTLGLITEEFDWVNNFIHDYRENLKEPYQESVFSFNLALLKYEQKDFNESLQLLQKSEYKDLLLNLAAKTLILKIYYELDEFDALLSHLDAMRIFIRRKRDLGYHRDNYLNTIRFTKKLIDINPFDKKAKVELKCEIENAKTVADKSWLLERVNLL